MVYEVLFFDGWGAEPAYYLVDGAEGDTPEAALASNLERITQQVRRLFSLSRGEVSDERIQETIYVLREHGLVSPRGLARVREK